MRCLRTGAGHQKASVVSELPDLQGGQGGWECSLITGRTWSRHAVKPVGALHARLGGFLLGQWVLVPIPQVEGTVTTWGLSPTSHVPGIRLVLACILYSVAVRTVFYVLCYQLSNLRGCGNSQALVRGQKYE